MARFVFSGVVLKAETKQKEDCVLYTVLPKTRFFYYQASVILSFLINSNCQREYQILL